MKIFTEKGIIKKIIIVLIAIIAFNAVIPTNVSFAADSTIGGSLLKPIVDLMLALGDFIMDLIHDVLYEFETALIRIDKDNGLLEFIIIAIIVIAAFAAVAAASVWLSSVALSVVGKIALSVGGTAAVLSGKGVAKIISFAAGGAIVAGMFAHSAWFSNEIVMPLYKVSPEEIFSGKIRWLNVNFFTDPEIHAEDIDTSTPIQEKEEHDSLKVVFTRDAHYQSGTNTITINVDIYGNKNDTQPQNTYNDSASYNIYSEEENQEPGNSQWGNKEINEFLKKYGYTGEELNCGATTASFDTKVMKSSKWSDENLDAIEAEITWKSTHETGDARAGRTKTTTTYIVTIYQGKWIGTETTTIGNQLKTTVAKWYYAIRNFVLVVMMVILLYIGIRIMLCGIASEKAKYKNMLIDWVVAICLIFVMHYIMVFSMNLVDGIISIFGSVNENNRFSIVYENNNKLEDELKKAQINAREKDLISVVEVTNEETGEIEKKEVISWDAKNFLGFARVQAAFNNAGNYRYMGWVMCYLVLVFYTLFFLVTYLKRVIYITFFTIMAPLVAMTYPLDKMHDGKAQAFNMWFKEYVFNLMIQPVHLLLYTVLISTAFDLASTNILYTLVALGFMMPAEKFLRKMFGFDKAQTPGFLSGAAGTALMVTGFNKLFHRKPSKGGRDDDGSSGGKSKGNEDSGFHTNIPKAFLAQEQGAGNRGAGIQNAISNVTTGGASTQNAASNRSTVRTPISQKYSGTSMARKKITPQGVKLKTPKENSTRINKILPGQLKTGAQKPTNSTDIEKSGWFARQKRAVARASKDYARQKFTRMSNNIADGKPITAIGRTLGGLYLGAGGALLGTTIGLASGDAKNVSQYGTTLGAAGYALGSRNQNPNYDVDSVYEEYQRGLYDSVEEYEQAQLEDEIKKFIENEKNQRQIREYLGLDSYDEAKSKMREYSTSIGAGIRDTENLAAIMNLVDDGVMTEEMAIVASQTYKKAGGKPKNMAKGSKERQHIEHLSQGIAKEALGNSASPEEIEQTAKIVMANLDTFGSYKDAIHER